MKGNLNQVSCCQPKQVDASDECAGNYGTINLNFQNNSSKLHEVFSILTLQSTLAYLESHLAAVKNNPKFSLMSLIRLISRVRLFIFSLYLLLDSN